jgi:hypothetical protein
MAGIEELIANETERERGAAVRHLRARAMFWDRQATTWAKHVSKALRNEALAIETAEHLKPTN